MTNLSRKTFAEISKLPPAPGCIICRKPIEKIGGRRIIAQKQRGTTISKKPISSGYEDFRNCVQLLKGRELYLITWGNSSFMTEEISERARNDYLDGKRPWFCQKCGHRQCPECGEPITRPVVADYLLNDGVSLHCPLFPFDPGCINPKCKKYRDWAREWGILKNTYARN